ncbi:MAG: hypothetical protein J5895_01110 [Alphaproteobacteria bacterium]|nr:hypothetical protein [Alphaproteobacteria bacterium]
MIKKLLSLFVCLFVLCGFESLSGQTDHFFVENLSPADWEIKQTGSSINAYNKAFDFELVFYVDSIIPSSPQCVSNKRIKDIKFNIDVYKRAQQGDTGWAKMVERMQIRFVGIGYDVQKKIYGSNLTKNNASYALGEVVHIGTLQFLAPYPCKQINNMTMKVTDLRVKNERIPALEMRFKLK